MTKKCHLTIEKKAPIFEICWLDNNRLSFKLILFFEDMSDILTDKQLKEYSIDQKESETFFDFNLGIPDSVKQDVQSKFKVYLNHFKSGRNRFKVSSGTKEDRLRAIKFVIQSVQIEDDSDYSVDVEDTDDGTLDRMVNKLNVPQKPDPAQTKSSSAPRHPPQQQTTPTQEAPSTTNGRERNERRNNNQKERGVGGNKFNQRGRGSGPNPKRKTTLDNAPHQNQRNERSNNQKNTHQRSKENNTQKPPNPKPTKTEQPAQSTENVEAKPSELQNNASGQGGGKNVGRGRGRGGTSRGARGNRGRGRGQGRGRGRGRSQRNNPAISIIDNVGNNSHNHYNRNRNNYDNSNSNKRKESRPNNRSHNASQNYPQQPQQIPTSISIPTPDNIVQKPIISEPIPQPVPEPVLMPKGLTPHLKHLLLLLSENDLTGMSDEAISESMKDYLNNNRMNTPPSKPDFEPKGLMNVPYLLGGFLIESFATDQPENIKHLDNKQIPTRTIINLQLPYNTPLSFETFKDKIQIGFDDFPGIPYEETNEYVSTILTTLSSRQMLVINFGNVDRANFSNEILDKLAQELDFVYLRTQETFDEDTESISFSLKIMQHNWSNEKEELIKNRIHDLFSKSCIYTCAKCGLFYSPNDGSQCFLTTHSGKQIPFESGEMEEVGEDEDTGEPVIYVKFECCGEVEKDEPGCVTTDTPNGDHEPFPDSLISNIEYSTEPIYN